MVENFKYCNSSTPWIWNKTEESQYIPAVLVRIGVPSKGQSKPKKSHPWLWTWSLSWVKMNLSIDILTYVLNINFTKRNNNRSITNSSMIKLWIHDNSINSKLTSPGKNDCLILDLGSRKLIWKIRRNLFCSLWLIQSVCHSCVLKRGGIGKMSSASSDFLCT